MKERGRRDDKRARQTRQKESINPQHEQILKWLKTVKFRRKLVGGLDQRDVWKKLEELYAIYETAILAERVRYNVLLTSLSQSGMIDGDELLRFDPDAELGNRP